MSEPSNTKGIASPVREPYEHDGCLPRHEVNMLLIAAKELLQVIDAAPIRKAALACGAEIYEKSAALIDAIAAAEGHKP